MTPSLVKTGFLFLFLLIIFPFRSVNAQFRCGFDGIMKQSRKENPGFEEELNKKIKEHILKRKSTTARLSGEQSTLYYVPVVVHVVHTGDAVGTTYNPTDATIQGAIDYLNAVYNGSWTGSGGSILGAGDLQIQFVLATKDPNGASSTGINRIDGSGVANYTTSGITIAANGVPNDLPVKDLSRWDPTAYYNIWVVNKIDGQDGTTPGVAFTAGYAYFPWYNNTVPTALQRDGIVMLATQMRAGQKTLPHEFGHAFNLYHPFEGEGNVTGGLNNCPANASPTTQGDWCTDTEPVINPADDGYGAMAFGCRTGTTNPCTGLTYSDNTERNFMNYTFCYQLFTNDQKARMQASFATTTREGLGGSWANNQGSYPTTWAPPVAAAVSPASPFLTTTYEDWLGIMNIKLNGKKVFTLNATQDGGYVDNAKWYNLFTLQPSTTYSMDIDLNYSGNNEQLGVWIDYNGDGSFNDATERGFYHPNIPATSQVTISFTTPPTLSGNIVRMRVMNDFSIIYGAPAINGSTASLVGGQAEDYPVFLMNPTPLPLTLLEFSGSTASANTYLNWKSEQELNTKEFQVQRSANGSDFITIGTVAARGNAAAETQYQFTDFNVSSGSYTYRLKMVDTDASFKFSKILHFTIEARTAVQVLGNPITNNIKMVLPDRTGPAAIRLLDTQGKVIVSRTITPSQPNTVDIPIGQQVSKGIYILETVVNHQRFIQKLVKE